MQEKMGSGAQVPRSAGTPKGFVVSVEFTHSGRGVTNYLESNSRFGFRSWSSDCAKAKRFDTRALARRAAQGVAGTVRIISPGQCSSLAEQSGA